MLSSISNLAHLYIFGRTEKEQDGLVVHMFYTIKCIEYALYKVQSTKRREHAMHKSGRVDTGFVLLLYFEVIRL